MQEIVWSGYSLALLTGGATVTLADGLAEIMRQAIYGLLQVNERLRRQTLGGWKGLSCLKCFRRMI